MTTFAAKLNRLFADVHSAHRRPHTNSEVAQALNERGHRISQPYLSQLRSGQRTNPSTETVAALAEFFQVKPDYFFDDVYAIAVADDLRFIQQMQSATLRRLTNRAFNLSQEAQALLISIAERLRASEGLPSTPVDELTVTGPSD